jgi:hypothetical protein
LTIQVLDISLDKISSKNNGIKLRLLGRDGRQGASDLRDKSRNNVENSSGFFVSDSSGRSGTTVSTGLLEKSFKSLFLVVDGKSTRVASSRGEAIDL